MAATKSAEEQETVTIGLLSEFSNEIMLVHGVLVNKEVKGGQLSSEDDVFVSCIPFLSPDRDARASVIQ